MWGRRGVPRLYAMTLPLSTYNMLDFNNTEIAFSSKSRGELQNAYWLFNTIKYPWLVKCAKVATSIALKIHFPLAWAVKPTLYKQFVGGETLQDCSAAINHLMKYNVKSTLDYSAESEQTPEGIQATFEETLRSIDFAKGNTNLAYAVFKPSTITTDELLAKASEKREELTIDDVRHFREFRERFMALCQRAYDNYETTDDHGMQIYGIAKDQEGNEYYMVKNSWGTNSKYNGIWYASKAFVRYKTMNIVVHKDALPKAIKAKLGIK